MYPSIKSNAVSEKEAIEIVGVELVSDVLSKNCEFTGRIIDDCYDVVELSAYAESETHTIEVLYLISKEESMYEDLSNADWSTYTFVVWEK